MVSTLSAYEYGSIVVSATAIAVIFWLLSDFTGIQRFTSAAIGGIVAAIVMAITLMVLKPS